MSMFLMDWIDAPPAPTTARADDTSKVYWYAPDSVVESGGVITSWDDKSANNYDLVQVGSLAKPTYASSSVVYTGSEVLGIAAHPHADGLKNVLATGGTIAVFIVARCDITGQAPSSSTQYIMLSEGQATSTGSNHHLVFYTTGATFATPRTVAMNCIARATSVAWSSLTVGASGDRNDALMLWRYVISQTDTDWRVHPFTATGTASVTPANFPVMGAGLHIGAMISGTTLSRGFIGAIHEVYATTDVSTGNVDAITTEIETVYGL